MRKIGWISIISILVVIVMLFSTTGSIAQTQKNNGTALIAPEGVTFMQLKGMVPPVLKYAKMTGAMPSNQKITVVIGFYPQNQSKLNQYINELQNPKSQYYHAWLSPSQFKAMYGLSNEQISQIENYFKSEGFSIVGVYPNNLGIKISGTVYLFEKNFKITMNEYSYRGHTYYSLSQDPSLSTIYAPLIASIDGLSNFNQPMPMIMPYLGNIEKQLENHGKLAPAQGTLNYMQNDIAKAYGMDKLYQLGYNGSGQTILLYGQSTPSLSDLRLWEKYNNLPQAQYNITPIDGGTAPASQSGGDLTENTLDVEWSSAMAPGAKIDMINANTSVPTAWDDAFAYAASQSYAKVFSISYGLPDIEMPQSEMAYESVLFKQMFTEGIAVFVATGDWGSNEFSPFPVGDIPSSYPWVTAVGGTRLLMYVNSSNLSSIALGRAMETTWGGGIIGQYFNTSGSGGGFSDYFPAPIWQVLANNGTGLGFTNPNRAYPDISLNADPYTGYGLVFQGALVAGGGGTSYASPASAGMWAVLNQISVKYTKKVLGDEAPYLYNLSYDFNNHAIGPSGSIVKYNPFNQITIGTNGEYFAKAGYSLTNGWGTPVMYNLSRDIIPGFNPAIALMYPSVSFVPTVISSYKLSVSFNYSPSTISYQFLQNGTSVQNSTSNTYSGNTGKMKPGIYNYTVKVWNGSTLASSANSYVVVYAYGNVSIRASPANSTVTANGIYMFKSYASPTTEWFNASLESGQYTITVNATGYKTQNIMVGVSSGTTKVVYVNLSTGSNPPTGIGISPIYNAMQPEIGYLSYYNNMTNFSTLFDAWDWIPSQYMVPMANYSSFATQSGYETMFYGNNSNTDVGLYGSGWVLLPYGVSIFDYQDYQIGSQLSNPQLMQPLLADNGVILSVDNLSIPSGPSSAFEGTHYAMNMLYLYDSEGVYVNTFGIIEVGLAQVRNSTGNWTELVYRNPYVNPTWTVLNSTKNTNNVVTFSMWTNGFNNIMVWQGTNTNSAPLFNISNWQTMLNGQYMVGAAILHRAIYSGSGDVLMGISGVGLYMVPEVVVPIVNVPYANVYIESSSINALYGQPYLTLPYLGIFNPNGSENLYTSEFYYLPAGRYTLIISEQYYITKIINITLSFNSIQYLFENLTYSPQTTSTLSLTIQSRYVMQPTVILDNWLAVPTTAVALSPQQTVYTTSYTLTRGIYNLSVLMPYNNPWVNNINITTFAYSTTITLTPINGWISGVVSPSGATVYIENSVTGATYSPTPSSSGAYSVALPSTYPYVVTVSESGYTTSTSIINVNPGQTSYDNVTLIKLYSPPTIPLTATLYSPAQGAVLTGNVTIGFNYTGSATSATLSINSQSGSSVYSANVLGMTNYVFNTYTVPNGGYTITYTVSNSTSTKTASVSVTVDNSVSALTATLYSPISGSVLTGNVTIGFGYTGSATSANLVIISSNGSVVLNKSVIGTTNLVFNTYTVPNGGYTIYYNVSNAKQSKSTSVTITINNQKTPSAAASTISSSTSSVMYIIVGLVVGIILGLIAMYMLRKPKMPVTNSPQQMENQQINTSDQVQSNNIFNNQPKQP